MNTKLGFGVIVVAVASWGCTPEARQDYSKAGNEAAQAMKKDADATAKAAKAATDAASKSLEKKEPGANNAVSNAPNAVMTPKVKAALMGVKGLDTSHLNVDTVDKTVILKGSVPSAHEKHEAEAVAKKTAGAGFQVKNQLGVQKG